jgi:hypothetical protein
VQLENEAAASLHTCRRNARVHAQAVACHRPVTGRRSAHAIRLGRGLRAS